MFATGNQFTRYFLRSSVCGRTSAGQERGTPLPSVGYHYSIDLAPQGDLWSESAVLESFPCKGAQAFVCCPDC